MITITRIENCQHHNVPRFRVDSKKYGTATLYLDGDGSMEIRGGEDFLTFNGIEYRCHVTLRTAEKHLPPLDRPPGFNPKDPQAQVYEMRNYQDVDGTRRNWTDYGKAKLSAAARRQLIAFAEEAAALVPVDALFDAEIQHLESQIEDKEVAARAAEIAVGDARREADALAVRMHGLEDLKAGLEAVTS